MNKSALDILSKYFQEAKKRNPSFSLRALARKLSFDPGALSNILSGKKKITPTIATKIIAHLELPTDDRQAFLESVWSDYEAKMLQELKRSRDTLFSVEQDTH